MKSLLHIIAFIVLISTIGNGQVIYYNDAKLECKPKVFHVSVHIALDSLGQANMDLEDIEEDLSIASDFFDPICWSFATCKIDTIVNYAFDRLNLIRFQKMQEYYNDDRMINLYYVDQAAMLEFCHVANVNGIADPTTAHVVMLKDCLPIDLVHKLGHLFGLEDTWANGGELVNGANCEIAGDQLCSTPADPYVLNSFLPFVNSNCEFQVNTTDDNGDFFAPQVGNIMSNYDGCRDGFTAEQYRLMLETYCSLTYIPW